MFNSRELQTFREWRDLSHHWPRSAAKLMLYFLRETIQEAVAPEMHQAVAERELWTRRSGLSWLKLDDNTLSRESFSHSAASCAFLLISRTSFASDRVIKMSVYLKTSSNCPHGGKCSSLVGYVLIFYRS